MCYHGKHVCYQYVLSVCYMSHILTGHVISADQLLPIALATGPTGVQLDFTYQSRNKPALVS